MKQLYFVRHGQSADNQLGVWSRPDTPLTERGREQARAAGRSIKASGQHFDLVITSAMPRAMETAELIAHEIGYDPVVIKHDALLNERSWGDLAGSHRLHDLPLGAAAVPLEHEPSTEKLGALERRAVQALHMLEALPETNILLVGHVGFANALLRVIRHQPHGDGFDPAKFVPFANGSLTRFV